MGLVLSVALAVALGSCSPSIRRFPLASPVWRDPDQGHVARRPAEHFSGLYADAVDKVMLRPLAELTALRSPGESRNVNALDEVPDSSWFHNRIGLFPMTPAEVARGPCDRAPLDPSRGPWIVTSAKTEGLTPGMFIKAPDGQRYLLKLDGPFRPQRGSAADVVGSRIYHAAGFHVPCNQVVSFPREVVRLSPDATTKDSSGRKRRLTEDDLRRILGQAFRLRDGRLRALASRILPGRPLGPHPLEGVRHDDPNDVIPHEDRRELRASRLLAAWLNHFDIREQNSLDMWVEEGGRRFVRHYQIDFGDCFGNTWPDDRKNRRVGHSYYVDFEHVLVDFLSLGMVPRPWFRERPAAEPEIFTFYSWVDFKPSAWRPIYPNPAFRRMTRRDALWMARIIARFSDDHLRAIVKEGRLTDPRDEAYLVEALIRRRDLILREYLGAHVPLDRFRLVRQAPGAATQLFCFEDLAVKHGVTDPARVVYKVRMHGGARLEEQLGWLQLRPDPEQPQRSCVLMPVGDRRPADLAPRTSPDDYPLRYGALTVYVRRHPDPRPERVVVYLYDRGPERGFVIVGIDRPPPPAHEELPWR